VALDGKLVHPTPPLFKLRWLFSVYSWCGATTSSLRFTNVGTKRTTKCWAALGILRTLMAMLISILLLLFAVASIAILTAVTQRWVGGQPKEAPKPRQFGEESKDSHKTFVFLPQTTT